MRDLKPGLSLEQHHLMAAELHRLQAQTQALRATIKTGIGSATIAYQQASRVLIALRNMENALVHEFAGEHAGTVDMATIRAIYSHEQQS